MVELIEGEQLLSQPSSDSNLAEYWSQLSLDPTAYVANVQTKFEFVIFNGAILPITVNSTELENSYVCSPFNATVTYPLEELRLLPGWLSFPIAGLIHTVAPWLRWGMINRVVVVNNWLLSTNLYPKLDPPTIDSLLRVLKEKYPQHAILFRSLNSVTNPDLIDHLRKSRYLLAPSRQVYLFDGKRPDFLNRHNTRIDWQLCRSEREYRVVDHDQLEKYFLPKTETNGQSQFGSTRESSTASDEILSTTRVKWLYDRLYIDKYSHHNPQFTNRLFRLWWRTRTLEFFGLESLDGGVGGLDGVLGCWKLGSTITAPVVGYATGLSQKFGLYRRLMALVLREAAEKGLMLNLSSGAAQFKRLRGGFPAIEYTAVGIEHLPNRQRRTWRILAGLLQRIGEPLLRRFEL